MGEPMLRHFSTMPVVEMRSARQSNPDPMAYHTKPRGLWVSDEASENSWSAWCESENFGRGVLEHLVELAPDANIITLSTTDDIDRFGQQYGVCSELRVFRNEPAIMWADVARDYDGIIITPYIWERRLHPGSSWYYSWDCASGCIWNKRAVARIEPILPPKEAAAQLEAWLAKDSPNA